MLKYFDPNILLGDRLGLTLYRIFAEAYLLKQLGKFEIDLYKKFINYFPKEKKRHTPDNFIKLIEDIKVKGFILYNPVYANPKEYALFEGSHRCAIAMALEIKDVPYALNFNDSRIDDNFIKKIFNEKEYKFLINKRENYISKCDKQVQLKCNIRIIMRQNRNSFQAPFSSNTKIPTQRLYQKFEPLGLLGKRSTIERFTFYDLEKYLSSSMNVLDIGCNVGFFSLTIARYVKNIDAFDTDQNYIKIANLVKDYLNIKNCNFLISQVEEFKTNRQYDFLISTAIHGWVKMSFIEYIHKLNTLVKEDGIILFESHEVDVHPEWLEKKALLLKAYKMLEEGIIDDVDTEIYKSEIREFLILKKTKNSNPILNSLIKEYKLIESKTKKSNILHNLLRFIKQKFKMENKG